MKPESRVSIFERHVAEAEQAIARQKQLILELERDGHSTKGSRILLGLLEEALQQAQSALATLKFARGQQPGQQQP